MATVIGTLKNIPIIPQIEPQRAKDNMATNALIFSVLPIIHGSIRLPTSIATVPTPIRIIMKGRNSPN